ncbi:transmembrane protein 223 [Microcaecilia unicolor]|uniref:Transmembrane protein 223 n=1 Tax=Microcaecilia unicolor TaxID=1415580 RepID=A0A6P7ZEN6_9AMPH|nr:transmembrane protein 223 [Microcaecilia unicolor]
MTFICRGWMTSGPPDVREGDVTGLLAEMLWWRPSLLLNCSRGAAWRAQAGSRGLHGEVPSRDVLLFQHERPRFFRLLRLFCAGQAGFWLYLAQFGFSSLRASPRERSPDTAGKPPAPNFRTVLWRWGFTLSCVIVGSAIVIGGCLFSRRSVSRIVLHGGGQQVTVSTADLFGLKPTHTVPICHVSCMAHRSEVPAMIPVKIKDYRFYFLLDKEGQIYNPKLFDVTIGTYRKL